MVRKSVGLAVLVLAIVALTLTWLTGSTTAAYDPLNPVPYLYLAPTGQHLVPAGNAIPMWAIAALAAAGSALIVYGGLRLRSRHR